MLASSVLEFYVHVYSLLRYNTLLILNVKPLQMLCHNTFLLSYFYVYLYVFVCVFFFFLFVCVGKNFFLLSNGFTNLILLLQGPTT